MFFFDLKKNRAGIIDNGGSKTNENDTYNSQKILALFEKLKTLVDECC
jgi:hypothetical protein